MSKIIVLVKKDLYFNLVMFISIFIVTMLLVLVAIYGLDSGKAGATLNYLVYTCIPSIIIVPYSYHLDDNLSTRKFIAALPVTFEKIVTAKYILSIITSTFIACIVLLTFNSLGEAVLYRYALIPILMSQVFTSIFVFIFYNWDANVARFSSMAPIIVFAFMAKKLERNYSINENLLAFKTLMILTIIVFIVTFIIKKITIKTANR